MDNINKGCVVCATELKVPDKVQSGLGSRSSHIHGTALLAVMSFEPLKEAFGEYCRKSLCSEVYVKNSFWKFLACVVYLGRSRALAM